MGASPPRHADLAAGRWQSLTLVEQLANVGSEVDRAIKAHEAGRSDRRDAAVDRGLELFDLTAADHRWRGARRREVLRAREEFCALFWGDGEQRGAAASLSRYFLHFALAARRAIRPLRRMRPRGRLRFDLLPNGKRLRFRCT